MPNMSTGILTVNTNSTKRKAIVFKRWMTIQLYAQSNFHGQLKMAVNKKGDYISSSLVPVGFEKLFYGM